MKQYTSVQFILKYRKFGEHLPLWSKLADEFIIVLTSKNKFQKIVNKITIILVILYELEFIGNF